MTGMSDVPPPPPPPPWRGQPPPPSWGGQPPPPPPSWGGQPAPPVWGGQPGPPVWGGQPDVALNPFDSRGTTTLVLGILGLVVCQILAPIAWILANGVRRDAAAAGWPEPGNARAGRILGIIGTALVALAVAFIAIVIIAAAVSSK